MTTDKVVANFNDCFPIILNAMLTGERLPESHGWQLGSCVVVIKKKRYTKHFKEVTHLQVSKNTKKYRNQLNKILKVAEKDFYSAGYQMSATNIRKTWQIIKGILNKNGGTAITETVKINGKKK